MQAAQRIVYFSALYQPLIFFTLGAVMTAYSYMSYFIVPDKLFSGLLSITTAAALLRLGAMFQGMRRQLGGSVMAGLAGAVACVDSWYFLLYAVQYFLF